MLPAENTQKWGDFLKVAPTPVLFVRGKSLQMGIVFACGQIYL